MTELDLRGLKCPLPVLRTRKTLLSLEKGACLRVTCTDPLAAIDLPHLVHETGNTVLAQEKDGEKLIFTIRKDASE